MSDQTAQNADIRNRILAAPDVILDDPDVMRALIAANERLLGTNVVDLRGVAMERLEAQLDRLEETHRNVIAAAYENLSGTNQLHRAVLRMLEPTDFGTFLRDLTGEVSQILRVDRAVLVIESDAGEDPGDPALEGLDGILKVRPKGFVDTYVGRGRGAPVRQVTLRQLGEGEHTLYGEMAGWLRSEACLKLDFGTGRLPGLLALGSEDPHVFSPAHGTDLLVFFGGAVERAMRRWLS